MNIHDPVEPVIEPDLPIVDAHHHLWIQPEVVLAALERSEDEASIRLAAAFRRNARYLVEEYLGDLNSGHNVRATVFMEADAMYRAEGAEVMRSLGEVEFANGMAAIAASGALTDIRICAGIVGSVDLRLGDAVEEILLAHIQAGGGRYRGVRGRHVVDTRSRTPGNFGPIPELLSNRGFHAGFRQLGKLGLSYDSWQLEHQLGDLPGLARAFPDTQIIVDHVGGLFGLGVPPEREPERFAAWRNNIKTLAGCSNIAMKLGGLAMPMSGLRSCFTTEAPTSQQLADDWRPYLETCIEAFGVERCMFESNFPVDSATTSYRTLWNAFKRVVSAASADEKAALFGGTAARLYRLAL